MNWIKSKEIEKVETLLEEEIKILHSFLRKLLNDF